MKVEVIKKKPTKLQAFFSRPLTLKQRVQVKLSVLMFRVRKALKCYSNH